MLEHESTVTGERDESVDGHQNGVESIAWNGNIPGVIAGCRIVPIQVFGDYVDTSVTAVAIVIKVGLFFDGSGVCEGTLRGRDLFHRERTFDDVDIKFDDYLWSEASKDER